MIKRFDLERSERRRQRFVFTAPNAGSVQLVGDFTHWTKQPINLKRGTNGLWETTVDLSKGLHLYRFLVDGEWRDDPESVLRISNPYGSQDAVTHIE